MSRATIIDYGIGNLLSVKRAFEANGAEVEFASSRNQILEAEHLILPGVGAFAKGMEELEKRGFVDAILQYCSMERPFLGICLGMQMMLEESEEQGNHKGLGLIRGRVQRIQEYDENCNLHKVPNIGWYSLDVLKKDKVFEHYDQDNRVYFVHSYCAHVDNRENLIAQYYYDTAPITAVIKKGNSYGMQFHPEKSGEVGLEMIRQFLDI